MKKVVVTIEVAEADVDETIIYLKYVKKQMERHTNMRISKVFVENEAIDNDHRYFREVIEDMKKAPSAKGAIVKLTPKV